MSAAKCRHCTCSHTWPDLTVINRAILTERIAKFLIRNPPWSGHFIYRFVFKLRDIDKVFYSPKYLHTFKTTEIGVIIKETFMKLKDSVKDWSSETFNSLKRRLHENKPYKQDKNRNYENIWNNIDQNIKNRKRKDIAYLTAHNALPTADVLANRGLKISRTCRLCSSENETRDHVFMKCRLIKTHVTI